MIDGDAVDVLSEVGERAGASMIVICSRGHGALAELVQESVSHELIQRAVSTVVVVPPRWVAPHARAFPAGGRPS
jgi:nucleotide-binding universal stress UspA family protein